MNVTFVDFGEHLASSRLRARIPQIELAKLGIKKGSDIVVYGKHWLDHKTVSKYRKKIYDICDDHFDDPVLGDYYRSHAASADLITCNSEVMSRIIKLKTSRDSVVIPEPYESDEALPSIGIDILWYGHASNLKDLQRIQDQIKNPLVIMTNKEGYLPWSLQTFANVMKHPLIVIIPTGKSMAKSENRMVEAIRNGKYVCAEHLPSYEVFDQFYPLGDIPEHIDRVLSNPEDAIQRIKAAQEYIRDRYSPKTIGKKWLEVLHVA